MGKYGNIGKPVMLYEAYLDWADDPEVQKSLEEANTKADFPEFLFGPISTSIYKGYTRVAPQYRRYARVESLTDFRPRRIKGLWGITGIGYVGDGGEYPEMNRKERESATLVIDTYGGVYGITRQTVINDDTGSLLRDNPGEMGYEAGQFIVNTVIAFIESNPTAPDGNATFTEGRGNITTAELSEDSLATGISFMENQLDANGRKIVVKARTLAVKNVRMELIANRIIRSQNTGATQTTEDTPGAKTNVFSKGTDNPLAGILPADAVVRDPYWSDANNWYLFADPEDVPAFAVGFLNGREEPQVFLKNPEAKAQTGGDDPYTWEWDSVDYKVRLDTGVGTVDPHGAYKGNPA